MDNNNNLKQTVINSISHFSIAYCIFLKKLSLTKPIQLLQNYDIIYKIHREFPNKC